MNSEKIFTKARMFRTLLAIILTGNLAIITVTPAFAASITGQQATNDATNVYYSFTYSGITPYYRVYIDTDQSTATGYNANGIGANYMVENGTLFSHPSNDSTWSERRSGRFGTMLGRVLCLLLDRRRRNCQRTGDRSLLALRHDWI